MNMKKILQYPHPILSTVCTDVEYINKNIHSAIQQCSYVLSMHSNGLAVAANQIGYTYRFFIYEGSDGKNNVIINPKIKYAEKPKIHLEGCLSFPGQHTLIERPDHIQVEYVNFPDLEIINREYTGIYARMFQHEIDHLDGFTFLERMNGKIRDEFLERFQRSLRNGRIRGKNLF